MRYGLDEASALGPTAESLSWVGGQGAGPVADLLLADLSPAGATVAESAVQSFSRLRARSPRGVALNILVERTGPLQDYFM